MPSARASAELMGTESTPEVMVRVLGRTSVTDAAGTLVPLSKTQRVILCRLAMGRLVAVDDLVEAVWPLGAPASARASLQNQIARLRAVLGRDSITTSDEGYRLTVPSDIARGRALALSADDSYASGAAQAAFDTCEEALSLVQGEPFADLIDLAAADLPRRATLGWIRVVEDIQAQAALSLGRGSFAVLRAHELYEAEPLDEGRAAMLARALAAVGRRGDALGVIDRTRHALRQDLGLDLSAELCRLRDSLLDPAPTREHEWAFRGRAKEMGMAQDALAEGRLVVVSAEPGGGVTRFLRELAGVVRTAAGSCALVSADPGPWAPGLELSEICDQLRVTSDDALGPYRGFVAAVGQAPGPVTILVDDADLLGPSSLAVLYRASQLPGVRVVLGAHTEMSLAGSYALDLPGLTQEEVDQLVADRVATSDPVARRSLWADTEGNPDLVTSLLMDERVQNWLAAPQEHETPMSRSLLDRVREQVRRLSPSARAALEILALTDARFTTAALDRLVPTRALSELVAARLVDASHGRIVLRWEGLRRGVVASIPPGRRADLHHAIVESIPNLPISVAAMHRRECASIDPDAAVTALVRAARDVSRLGAHDDAARWLTDALDVVHSHPNAITRETEVRVCIELGDALRLAGAPEHVDVLVNALEAAEDAGTEVWLQAAFALLQLGATTESGTAHPAVVRVTEVLDRAAADEGGPDDAVATVRAAASLAWSMCGEAARSRELFLQAEAGARSPTTRRAVLPFAYLALGHPADLEHRATLTDELAALARATDDPVAAFEALHLQFSTALIRPDKATLQAALATMHAVIDRVGDVGRRWSLLYQEATATHLEGRDQDAEDLANQAFELFSPVSANRAFAAYASQLLALRITQGRVEELAPVVLDLVADQPGVRAWQAVAALTQARSDPEAAALHARQVLTSTDHDFTWLAAHVIGGRAAAQTGRLDLAHDYLVRLTPWSGLGCWQGNCSLGPVDTTLALLARGLGDAEASSRFATAAHAVARRLGSAAHLADLERLGL